MSDQRMLDSGAMGPSGRAASESGASRRREPQLILGVADHQKAPTTTNDPDIYKAVILRCLGYGGYERSKLVAAFLITLLLQVALLACVARGFTPRFQSRVNAEVSFDVSRQSLDLLVLALCKIAALGALVLFTHAEAHSAVEAFHLVSSAATWGWCHCALFVVPLLQLAAATVTLLLEGLLFESYYLSNDPADARNMLEIIFAAVALQFVLQLDNQAFYLLRATNIPVKASANTISPTANVPPRCLAQCLRNSLHAFAIFLFHLVAMFYNCVFAILLYLFATDDSITNRLHVVLGFVAAVVCFSLVQTMSLKLQPPRLLTCCNGCCSGDFESGIASGSMGSRVGDTVGRYVVSSNPICMWYYMMLNVVVPAICGFATRMIYMVFNRSALNSQQRCVCNFANAASINQLVNPLAQTCTNSSLTSSFQCSPSDGRIPTLNWACMLITMQQICPSINPCDGAHVLTAPDVLFNKCLLHWYVWYPAAITGFCCILCILGFACLLGPGRISKQPLLPEIAPAVDTASTSSTSVHTRRRAQLAAVQAGAAAGPSQSEPAGLRAAAVSARPYGPRTASLDAASSRLERLSRPAMPRTHSASQTTGHSSPTPARRAAGLKFVPMVRPAVTAAGPSALSTHTATAQGVAVPAGRQVMDPFPAIFEAVPGRLPAAPAARRVSAELPLSLSSEQQLLSPRTASAWQGMLPPALAASPRTAAQAAATAQPAGQQKLLPTWHSMPTGSAVSAEAAAGLPAAAEVEQRLLSPRAAVQAAAHSAGPAAQQGFLSTWHSTPTESTASAAEAAAPAALPALPLATSPIATPVETPVSTAGAGDAAFLPAAAALRPSHAALTPAATPAESPMSAVAAGDQLRPAALPAAAAAHLSVPPGSSESAVSSISAAQPGLTTSRVPAAAHLQVPGGSESTVSSISLPPAAGPVVAPAVAAAAIPAAGPTLGDLVYVTENRGSNTGTTNSRW